MKLVFKILTALVGGVIVLGLIGIVIFRGTIKDRVQLYQTKALQSEAEINLFLGHTNQITFFALHGVYTSAILGAGMDSSKYLISNYKIGFAKATDLDQTLQLQAKEMDPDFDISLYNSDKLGLFPTNEKSKGIDFETLASRYGCFAEANKFKICAIGYAGNMEQINIMTIDQDKKMVNEFMAAPK